MSTQRRPDYIDAPRVARRLLALLVPSTHRECVLGDAAEAYQMNVVARGALSARWQYWKELPAERCPHAGNTGRNCGRPSRSASSPVATVVYRPIHVHSKA